MTPISVTNPTYVRNKSGAIVAGVVNVVATFQELQSLGPMPFTASQTDVEPWGVQIYTDTMAGKYGPITG